LDWARLPHIQPNPEEAILERNLWTLYEFLLVKGTNELKRAALSLVRQYVKVHQPSALKRLCGRPLVALTGDADQLSLGYVIDLLVSLGISPHDIMGNTQLSP